MQNVKRGVLVVALAASLVGATTAASAQGTPAPAPGGAQVAVAGAPSAPAKPAAQKPAAQKPAAQKPEPTGLERLSSDWPKWLKVGALYRGRVESVRPVTGKITSYDGYYLNRVRLSASVTAGKWLQVVTQIQDVEVMGYGTAPAPKTMAGGFDLRQGYVEIGRKGPRGLLLGGGRQEYTLGDGRLIASPDWGNSSRTYDMGRVSGTLGHLKLDVFRAAPVEIDPAKFDRVKPGEYFWGGYATLDKLAGVSLVDVYVLQKATSVAAGELGSKGDGRVYTYGARLGGPLAKSLAYDLDVAVQRGHLANDDVSAWAAHAAASWTATGTAGKPRVTLEYDYASGDGNAKDGSRQTFDQMYASNHAKYGLADLIGWRNMHAVEAKFDVAPARKLKLSAALNKLMLATVADSWYGSSGSKVVLNAKATSRDIGWEPDLLVAYAVSKEMTLAAGMAVLLPGDYVRQSTSLDRYWYPYASWTLKF